MSVLILTIPFADAFVTAVADLVELLVHMGCMVKYTSTKLTQTAIKSRLMKPSSRQNQILPLT